MHRETLTSTLLYIKFLFVCHIECTISIMKISHLIWPRKIIYVCFANHMKHTNTVCELCDEMSSVHTYTYHIWVMYMFQEDLNCVDLERYDLPTQVALYCIGEAVESTTSFYNNV
jgi:hypothetical protein